MNIQNALPSVHASDCLTTPPQKVQKMYETLVSLLYFCIYIRSILVHVSHQ